MSLEENINRFIKEAIVDLACDNNINHRNYDNNKRDPMFKNKLIKNNYNVDLTVEQIVKEILSNKIITKKIQKFQKNNKITFNAQPKDTTLNSYIDKEALDDENVELDDENVELGNENVELGNENVELGNEGVELGNEGVELGNEDLDLDDEGVELGNEDLDLDDEDLDLDEEEELEELKTELFNDFIEKSGLYEINSLHGDYNDRFVNKFFEAIATFK